MYNNNYGYQLLLRIIILILRIKEEWWLNYNFWSREPALVLIMEQGRWCAVVKKYVASFFPFYWLYVLWERLKPNIISVPLKNVFSLLCNNPLVSRLHCRFIKERWIWLFIMNELAIILVESVLYETRHMYVLRKYLVKVSRYILVCIHILMRVSTHTCSHTHRLFVVSCLTE